MATGIFVETTTVFDSDLDKVPDEVKQLIIKIRQSLNKISMVLNVKDTGVYSPDELICAKTYPPNPNITPVTPSGAKKRMSIRKFFRIDRTATVPVGLPVGLLQIPHGINITLPAVAEWTLTLLDATANDINARLYYKLPHIDPGGNNISIWVDQNNINISTVAGYPGCTIIYVTLEYLTS